jgi:hypothetical protein
MESKGGVITLVVWERYGFRIGTLAKIQGKILEFKRFRSSSGLVSLQNADNSDS